MESVSTWDGFVVTLRLLCAQTHGRVLWGGITEACAVLTSPAVSRVGIDLTPAVVQCRHQLGLEPEKMSFTSPSTLSHS